MGGGVAMRVAAKFAGVVSGTFRCGFPAFPKNLTSAAFKAYTTRPITGVVSETQYDAAYSVVNSCDVGQPLPRLVFGGAPTLEEAQDATIQLITALDQAYLSNVTNEGSCESDTGHDKLALSDSVYLESKTCVTKASAPNQAIQAFRLLKESARVQTVVASIASDPNVWTAVMKNEDLWEYIQSQNTGMNGSLEESIAYTENPGYESANYSNDETFDDKDETFDDKERKNGFDSFFEDIKSRNGFDSFFEDNKSRNGFDSFFEDIKSRLEDMMNSFFSFFQNLFAGPAAADGSAKVDKTIVGASIMGLAVMVIMVVVFKRV